MEAIQKILGYKTWSDKRKYDALMEIDCMLYTNLGIDSTKKDREEVKKTSRKIYRAVKGLNFLLKEGKAHITSDKVAVDYLNAMDRA